MSLFKFSKNINISKKIDLYNYGNHIRDWTYVEDVVSGIYKIISKPPKENIPFNIFNVASDQPRSLRYFLKTIENNLGKKAKIKNIKVFFKKSSMLFVYFLNLFNNLF